MKPRIKLLRKEKGYLQSYVAEQLGIRQQSLSEWENSHSYPNYENAYKLAKFFGVPMEDLYEEE